MCITVKEMNEKMQEIQSLKRKLNRIYPRDSKQCSGYQIIIDGNTGSWKISDCLYEKISWKA